MQEKWADKDLGDFDDGQIVMARRLGQSLSETARLVRSSVMRIYQQRRDKPQTGDRVLDVQGSLMHMGNEGYLVLANRRSAVAQVTQNYNVGYGRNVSQHISL